MFGATQGVYEDEDEDDAPLAGEFQTLDGNGDVQERTPLVFSGSGPWDFSVGRDPNSDCLIDERSVSFKHATLSAYISHHPAHNVAPNKWGHRSAKCSPVAQSVLL